MATPYVTNEEWSGTREVKKGAQPCAFCLEDQCEKCPHEIAWYDSLWLCSCECNDKYVPKNIVAVKRKKEVK